MTKRRCALVVLCCLVVAVMAFAQEPAAQTRPERFLMLLKVGDNVSWLPSLELNGYQLTIYPDNRFTEILAERQKRRLEVEEASRLGVGNRAAVENAIAKERVMSELGSVAFVGQDYIAIAFVDDESREIFIPAWQIARIGRAREAKQSE